MDAGAIELDGDGQKLIDLLEMFDTFTPDFPMVTP